jgi:hypothetical protein
MKSAIRLTPADRDRAMDRLRNLTIGTAVASFLAVAGLGTVAAATHPGSSNDDAGRTTAALSDDAADETTTTTTTTTSNSSLKATTTSPSTTSGKAHVSTGSS